MMSDNPSKVRANRDMRRATVRKNDGKTYLLEEKNPDACANFSSQIRAYGRIMGVVKNVSRRAQSVLPLRNT